MSYGEKIILNNINFSLMGGEHLAITGNNGTGKTTLFKAIMDDPTVNREGDWYTPKPDEIGYLNQHYSNLNDSNTVYQEIEALTSDKSPTQLRHFLQDFLFLTNADVQKEIKFLSGGEKARLCLAKIALKTPKLLLLDEISNNIDLATKTHIIKVLKSYPGTLLIISHDNKFLKALQIEQFYYIT
ncbi:MAG: ATP-binding cassette domain-containing protein [Spirochaetaceae bacterium]|nr:ATP-binding cassette domain-containing protein [Spirochaetaceae bacterium]